MWLDLKAKLNILDVQLIKRPRPYPAQNALYFFVVFARRISLEEESCALLSLVKKEVCDGCGRKEWVRERMKTHTHVGERETVFFVLAMLNSFLPYLSFSPFRKYQTSERIGRVPLLFFPFESRCRRRLKTACLMQLEFVSLSIIPRYNNNKG